MTHATNDDQRDFWSGPSGQAWVTSQEEMDAQHVEAAELVIRVADPQPGQRVIDIGSGSGALSLMAAAKVGPTGRVLATDISEPLLGRAAERSADVPQMGTFLGDAQTADWPEGNFDIAVSRYGVMFFADPPAAFANICRALKPGGRIVFAAWAAAKKNPFWSVPGSCVKSVLGMMPAVDPDGPGPLGLSNMDLAIERLQKGGLADVEVREEPIFLHHADGARGMANLSTRIGGGRRALTYFESGEAEERALEDCIAEKLAVYEVDGQFRLPATINLLTARKP